MKQMSISANAGSNAGCNHTRPPNQTARCANTPLIEPQGIPPPLNLSHQVLRENRFLLHYAGKGKSYEQQDERKW